MFLFHENNSLVPKVGSLIQWFTFLISSFYETARDFDVKLGNIILGIDYTAYAAVAAAPRF